MDERLIRNVVVANDHACVAGGASEVAIREAVWLARNGIRVIFFACVGPSDPRLEQAGVTVVLTNQPELKEKKGIGAYWEGIWNQRAARRLREILRGLPPDSTVVHAHSISKALTASILAAAKNSGFRWVLTAHEYFLDCPNGGYFDYQRKVHCQLRGLSGRCVLTNCDRVGYTHKLYRVMKALAARTLGGLPRRASCVVILSNWSARILQPALSRVRTARLSNPLGLPECAQSDPAKSGTFLYVGQLSEEKGVLLLARAARDAGVSVRFVGDGAMKEKIAQIHPDAELCGWLRPEEVASQYMMARAVVFPSIWHEVEPLVPLEAMARGVPVICANTNAGADYIQPGINGLLFDGHDPAMLGRVLSDCLSNDLVRRLGDGAYQTYWKSRQDDEEHGRQLLEIYESVVRTAKTVTDRC